MTRTEAIVETKRICDINGDLCEEPEGYQAAVTAIREMIESMEENNIDRSDMTVVLEWLFSEARFHKTFLDRREDISAN